MIIEDNKGFPYIYLINTIKNIHTITYYIYYILYIISIYLNHERLRR